MISEFEPRPNLDQPQMSFDCLMGYIMSISMCMQKFIKIFHSVQEIGLFSLFQNGLSVIDIFHEQAGDKIFTNCPVTKLNVRL